MAYRLERQDSVGSDLEEILDFLASSAVRFGNSTEEAEAEAERRLSQLAHDLHGLSQAPYRGTLRPDLGTGVRNVTMDRFIVYFEIFEETKTVRILAVFHGGQDHTRRMLARLLR